MLLQVEVYPCQHENVGEGLTPEELQKHLEELATTPSETVYPCIGTTQQAGRLLTVGRKIGDIVLTHDKSVSREHCVLRIVSNNKKHTTPIEEGSSDGSIAGVAIEPRTDAERKACEESGDGMCLVLETIGRLGCYVVQEPGKVDIKEPKNDPQTAAALPPLSHVAQRLSKDASKSSLKLIGPEQTVILTELKLDLEESDAECDPVTWRRVIVQCGKLGSTLVIRRTPIRFVCSRNEKIGHELADKLHLIDAHETTFTAPGSLVDIPSHYLSKARSATPSQLTAWCMGIPICQPSFLISCLERTKVSDPMPDLSSPELEPKSDGCSFWYNKPQLKLWKHWTFLSSVDDDMEVMIQGAGAKVIQLYNASNDEEAATYAEQILASCQKNGQILCFCLDSKAKLASVVKDAGVPQLTTKQLAKSLCTQKMPDGSEPMEMEEEIEVEPSQEVSMGNAESATAKEDESPAVIESTARPFDKVPTVELEGGWLAAPPKGPQRRMLIRTKNEIMEVLGRDDVMDAALTERCKGMVVAGGSDGEKQQQTQKVFKSGLDFKRFRKNSVPQPLQDKIRLRSVLPKEDHKQDLDKERKALEEQQRKADDLFGEASKRQRLQ